MQDGMNITAIRDAIEKVFATFNEWGPDWREAQTRYAIIDPILSALGWDTSDPKECRPEWQFKGSKQRVDYALFSGNTPANSPAEMRFPSSSSSASCSGPSSGKKTAISSKPTWTRNHG